VAGVLAARVVARHEQLAGRHLAVARGERRRPRPAGQGIALDGGDSLDPQVEVAGRQPIERDPEDDDLAAGNAARPAHPAGDSPLAVAERGRHAAAADPHQQQAAAQDAGEQPRCQQRRDDHGNTSTSR
jgi:hypothetical protein